MLNLKNNKNEALFDEICKKKRRLKIISKNEGYFFGHHPLIEKSPTPSGVYDYLDQAEDNLEMQLWRV